MKKTDIHPNFVPYLSCFVLARPGFADDFPSAVSAEHRPG